MKFSILSLAVAGLVGLAKASVSPVHVDGRYFFYENGTRFFLKGIAYQPNVDDSDTEGTLFVDPLSDGDACSRDVPYFQELSVNAIRVYAVNASLDHSACMQAFQDAGIYVLSDLAQPYEAISSSDPTWTVDLFSRYTEVVDSLAPYDNMLGFIAGNEVIQNDTNTNAAAFVKAAVRDVKSYIKSSGYRQIPVGYSTNDEEVTRDPMAYYFDCGDDDDHVDFYGINIYEWCGDSDFVTSGYQERTEEFSNMTVPMIFSEFGCIEVRPRTFSEIVALFSDNMTDVWSGGIAYQYFESENEYGVVTVSGDSVSTLTDFPYLSSRYASVIPSASYESTMSATLTATMSCQATNSAWMAATSLPPTPSEAVCECMDSTRSCVINDDVSSDDYSDLFSYVCNEISCDGITANGTYPGQYGSYSYCDAKQQLDYVLDAYYSAKGDCDFSGSATLVSASSATGTCASYLSAAGSSATNAISLTADSNAVSRNSSASTMSTSYTSGSGSSNSSGSSSNSSSKSSSGASSYNLNMVITFLSVVIGGTAVLFI